MARNTPWTIKGETSLTLCLPLRYTNNAIVFLFHVSVAELCLVTETQTRLVLAI